MLTSVIILGCFGLLLVVSDYLAHARLQRPYAGPATPPVPVLPVYSRSGLSRVAFGPVRPPAPAPYFRPNLFPSGATASRP